VKSHSRSLTESEISLYVNEKMANLGVNKNRVQK
jgi:hypothetical protein